MGIRDPVKSRNLPFGGRGGRCVGAVSRAGPEEEILLPFLNEYCTIKSDIRNVWFFMTDMQYRHGKTRRSAAAEEA